ncbi:hypothetical protein PHMEG_0007962 [Phytophthora megakarya]|uniref:Uncharacterized protein n=1 Tax=Phytophthora megakarya TaxID=4795 RepID=A0A225WKS1_9STRA|nr:hypothetical protein PHMEG_0007962 [Phytophthora megakarya]
MLAEVNMNQVRFRSSVARDGTQTLPDIVRCLWGQILSDPRPNKDLFEIATSVDPTRALTIGEWDKIVQHGVIPKWTTGRSHTALAIMVASEGYLHKYAGIYEWGNSSDDVS